MLSLGVGKDAGTAKGQLQAREPTVEHVESIHQMRRGRLWMDGWMHLIIKQAPIIEPGMRMVLEPDKTRSCCLATGMTINLELGGGDGNRSENVILNL